MLATNFGKLVLSHAALESAGGEHFVAYLVDGSPTSYVCCRASKLRFFGWLSRVHLNLLCVPARSLAASVRRAINEASKKNTGRKCERAKVDPH